MNQRKTLSTACAVIPVIITVGLIAHRVALSQNSRQNVGFTRAGLSEAPEVKIEVRDGYRFITSNGIPDHSTGQFPNAGSPNSISPQRYRWRVTTTPKLSSSTSLAKVFGVAINGIPFDPGTAELWNNDFRWHYEALSGLLAARGGLGVDDNLAHVQPNGAYHYHGLPTALLKRFDYKNRPALIGYAADGFAIYGNYGYSNASDSNSPLKVLKSSYRIRSGTRPGGSAGPGGAFDGSFAQDYEFVKGLGDLDESNGRTGVTPEYPQGSYYYVLTENWPFVPRQFRGTPDPSFTNRMGPGGPGGQGPGGFGQPGPGGPGFPPQRGGPPAGFVPAEPLRKYLGLSKDQNHKLDTYVKVVEAIRSTRFALPAIAQLRLTESQMTRIASGASVESVLAADQMKTFRANQRPPFPGGPGFGPGGPGGPDGRPGGGPPPGAP